MRVLVACEFSGVVREAFARLGHDAWSCDLLTTEIPGQHIQGDAIETAYGQPFDLMIAHPPCTYLSRAGARWFKQEGREEKAQEAFNFVKALWDAPINQIAIENPIGKLNQYWRYPDQIIEPFYFGHPFSKRTCLWLKNLPPLMSTMTESKVTAYLPSNTTGHKRGQKSQKGHVHNAKDASRTFQGIANAMANQWS